MVIPCWFRNSLSVPSSRVTQNDLDCLTTEDGTVDFFETSIRNYHSTLGKIPRQQVSFTLGVSMKSSKVLTSSKNANNKSCC
jgi:hypothetical protein